VQVFGEDLLTTLWQVHIWQRALLVEFRLVLWQTILTGTVLIQFSPALNRLLLVIIINLDRAVHLHRAVVLTGISPVLFVCMLPDHVASDD